LTELTPFLIPADVQQRSRELEARKARGEVFTLEEAAAFLGLEPEFMRAAVALQVALETGQRVIIDPLDPAFVSSH
jgi:hypothetical protein